MIWDLESEHITQRPFKSHSIITTVAFSPDDRRLIFGHYNSLICIWDVQTGDNILKVETYSTEIYAVALSSDGNRVVSSDAQGNVLIWDSQCGVIGCILDKSQYTTGFLSFSADSRMVMNPSEQDLSVWNAQTGRLLPLSSIDCSPLECVCFKPAACSLWQKLSWLAGSFSIMDVRLRFRAFQGSEIHRCTLRRRYLSVFSRTRTFRAGIALSY